MTREEWDRWQPKASGEVSCTDLYLAKEELRIRELAFSCAVNLIASAIGNCEVKTFSDGRPKHGAEYYTWNVEPNFSQSSTAFWHKLVYQLYSAGEALVIPLRRDGRNQLLVADAWGASPFDPAKETEYTGVTVDGYQFGQTFRESDVLHFRLFHCNTKAVVDAMVNSYYKLFDTASRAFQWSAPGKHFKVHVNQVQAGAADFNEKFAERMQKQVKPWMNAENGVLPEFDGYEYTDMSPAGGGQTSRDLRALIDDVFDFTFNAFCIPAALFRGTATNIQDVVAHWLTVCIDPLAAMLGEEITRKRYGLAGWRRGNYVLVDTSTLQHFDIFANASNIEKLVGSGAFSINDVLAAAGRAEIAEDWAAKHWLTLNITSIEHAAQAAETAGEEEPNSA